MYSKDVKGLDKVGKDLKHNNTEYNTIDYRPKVVLREYHSALLQRITESHTAYTAEASHQCEQQYLRVQSIRQFKLNLMEWRSIHHGKTTNIC